MKSLLQVRYDLWFKENAGKFVSRRNMLFFSWINHRSTTTNPKLESVKYVWEFEIHVQELKKRLTAAPNLSCVTDINYHSYSRAVLTSLPYPVLVAMDFTTLQIGYHVNYPRKMNIPSAKPMKCVQLNRLQLYGIFRISLKLIPTAVCKYMHSWVAFCDEKKQALSSCLLICVYTHNSPSLHTHFRFRIKMMCRCYLICVFLYLWFI